MVGFSRIQRALERTAADGVRDAQFPAAVRRAVDRAARTVPGSACLERSVVAYRLLRSGGHAAALTIGVSRTPPQSARVAAHAWVHSGALLVTGDADDADLSRFTALTTIRGDA